MITSINTVFCGERRVSCREIRQFNATPWNDTRHSLRDARLETIISLCDKTVSIADIGCDHGFVSYELIKRGIAQNVIACDISEKSLSKAKKLAEEKRLETMECRISDGFFAINPGEITAAVIAGMGTPLIEKILKNDEKIAKSLDYIVICSHNYPKRLRIFLLGNDYSITDERIAKVGARFYPIMKIVKDSSDIDEKKIIYSEPELEIGKMEFLQNELEFPEYIKFRLAEQRRIARSKPDNEQENWLIKMLEKLL